MCNRPHGGAARSAAGGAGGSERCSGCAGRCDPCRPHAGEKALQGLLRKHGAKVGERLPAVPLLRERGGA